MIIYIPTRNRHNLQKSYTHLTPELRKKVVFVIDYNDDPLHYKKHYPSHDVMLLPKSTANSFCRMCQYILENAESKYFCILNDDLRFEFKKTNLKIERSTPAQVNKAFSLMEEWLDEGYAHCGMIQRSLQYNKRAPGYLENVRMMECLCYNRDILMAEKCSFTHKVSKGFLMADMHMNLQLLEKGYPNIVSLIYVLGASPSNARGGASDYRTLELQNKSSAELYNNNKEFVKLKEAKSIWKGHDAPRIDVIVQWKKALKKDV